MTEFAPCPSCGSRNAKKLSFTWWGGMLGPAIFSHVKCLACGTRYNGKTGRSNTGPIAIYTVVTLIIVIIVIGLLWNI